MSDLSANQGAEGGQAPHQNVDLNVTGPQKTTDFATLLGLIFSIALIGIAIYIGQSNAQFFNIPSLLIVILGTITVTTISYSFAEIKIVGQILAKALFKTEYSPSTLARELLDMAVTAKKKGILALTSVENELQKDPFLFRATQMVTDGYTAQDIEHVLGQEIDMLSDRHRRAAGILRRAAEVAPAMGLIGTLVGLVQMLADLNDPDKIGPAMAVALLTTFYGAVMGTVVIGPLAGKLENNSNDETLRKNLILSAMMAIAKQENPRRLEMMLNSELPPAERIRYFD